MSRVRDGLRMRPREGRTAFFGGLDDVLNVLGFRGGEDFDQLRNDRACDGAAGDDQCQFPPHAAVTHGRDQEVRRDKCKGNRNERCDPDQGG